MNILQKILFAQDFTPSSSGLESVAQVIAQKFKSMVIPIHVLPDDIVNKKVKTLLEETATAKLDTTLKHFKAVGISADNSVLKYGSPHEAIVTSASTLGANFILVGSGEGREGDKFKLGTTAERIIQNSEKPVLVIKEGSEFNVKTMLCPVDFSNPSKRALKNAIILARRLQSELIVLSVSEPTSATWFSSKEAIDKENTDRHHRHQEGFADFLAEFKFDDLNWRKMELIGDPAHEILETINRCNVDLLVIGTAGRSGINRLVVGSVTEKVIREVPCSFLTLKSQDLIHLQLQTDIKDFETLFDSGQQLENDGMYKEAIEQYKASLAINTMHFPAYTAIARLFEKLGEPEKAALYRKSAHEIKERIWYKKVEQEVRKLRGS